MSDAPMTKRRTLSAKGYAKQAAKRADEARNFPANTCPASRHVQMIGDILAKGKCYPMIDENPEDVAGSMLDTVASLYRARTEIAALEATVARLSGPVSEEEVEDACDNLPVPPDRDDMGRALTAFLERRMKG